MSFETLTSVGRRLNWCGRQYHVIRYGEYYFLLKEDVSSDYAKKLVTEEVKKYKDSLNKNKTQYKILSEETQADGSVIIEIKKQYNTSPIGHYLD